MTDNNTIKIQLDDFVAGTRAPIFLLLHS